MISFDVKLFFTSVSFYKTIDLTLERVYDRKQTQQLQELSQRKYFHCAQGIYYLE